jgi:hypothetical protein
MYGGGEMLHKHFANKNSNTKEIIEKNHSMCFFHIMLWENYSLWWKKKV